MAKKQRSSNSPIGDTFRVFATKASLVVGTKWAFLAALMMIVAWGLSGPHFRYSDTWQLVVNTSTTIVTFLMVFLIQNTQNRDARAIHLKLDEVIRSIELAHNEMIDIENLSDEELAKLAGKFERIRSESETRHKSKEAPSRTGSQSQNC